MSQKSTEKVMEMLTQDWAMSLEERAGRLEVREYRRDTRVQIDWSVGIIDGCVTLVLCLPDSSQKPIWVDEREHFALPFGPENKELLVCLLAYCHLAYGFKDGKFIQDVLDSTLVKLRELFDSQRPLGA